MDDIKAKSGRPHPGYQSPADLLAMQERRHQVSAMYIQGKTQGEIAKRFSVNQSVISRDLRAIRREWLRDSIQDFDKLKAKELAKIDQVELEAWKAWTRSQEPAETVLFISGRKRNYSRETMKGQSGDPRFLDVVMECVRRRCAILGIDAPKKKELSGPGGGPIQSQVKEDLFERIAQYRAYLESIRNGSTSGNGTPVATNAPVRNGILPETNGDEKNGHV